MITQNDKNNDKKNIHKIYNHLKKIFNSFKM